RLLPALEPLWVQGRPKVQDRRPLYPSFLARLTDRSTIHQEIRSRRRSGFPDGHSPLIK
ncbi:unnamed protein product, partial [Heterosigma akashiwo]